MIVVQNVYSEVDFLTLTSHCEYEQNGVTEWAAVPIPRKFKG